MNHLVSLLKPIQIGNICIEHPILLAPLSGVSDVPFRKAVCAFGAGLVFSEMIASKLQIEQCQNTLKMTEKAVGQRYCVVQLAGYDPDDMALAAKMNADAGADIIDINFGCPAKKIVQNMAGSALMQVEQRQLAIDILKKTVKAVKIPVTLKMRLGWDETQFHAPIMAQIAEDLGIQMLTVHGRYRQQMYTGQADWEKIALVKQSVKIPVIANGDITSSATAIQALQISGADGVMVGRATYGKPWLIAQMIADLWGKPFYVPCLNDIYQIMLRHYQDILTHYGEHAGHKIARKHLGWYLNHFPNGAEHQQQINKQATPADLVAYLHKHLAV